MNSVLIPTGSVPVVTSGGVLLGYVFPVPVDPDQHDARCTHGVGVSHWSYVMASSGYRSPWLTSTREASVEALVAQYGEHIDPDTVELVDLDLAARLHQLGRTDATPGQVAQAALLLASGQLVADLDRAYSDSDTAAGPVWIRRALVREVLRSLLGPATAGDVLRVYDAMASDHDVRAGEVPA